MGGWAVVSQAPSTAPPAGPPNPWAVRSTTLVSADQQAQREADARPKDTPVEQQGLFRSFYETAIKLTVDLVKDAYDRNDLGEHAASQILDSFTDQVKNFAGHPDIRNLPVIGTGATATAARMQKQFDAGNYAGMIGSAAGFIAPFATPAAIAAAPDAGAAIKTAAPQAWEGLKAGAKAAAPDVAVGTAKAAAGAVLGHFLPGPIAGGLVEAAGAAKGAAQVGSGLLKGARAFGQAYRDAAPVAEAAPAAPPFAPAGLLPAGPLVTPAPADTSFVRSVPAEYPPAAPFAPKALLPAAPAPALVTPAPEDASFVRGVPAEYGAPAAAAEAAPAANPWAVVSHEPVPEVTAAQRLEDAADAHAAYLQHQAEDIMWANRARKADRFAEYLGKNNLDPTPENLAAAAKTLAERKPPSAETIPMIHDRLGYTEPGAAPDVPMEDLAIGPHGPIAEHLRGNASGAVQWLRDNETGEVPAALNNPDPRVGDIDLLWGTPGNAAKEYRGGYGLSHILAKHEEMRAQMGNLGQIVRRMKVTQERDGQEMRLEDGRYRAIVSKVWQPRGQQASAKTWLLTAFEPK